MLIRARAIETGAFVLAATQGGLHENGRATFGHSLIVSPWGEVLAEAGEEPGVIFAEIDLAAVRRSPRPHPRAQAWPRVRDRDRRPPAAAARREAS